MSNAFTFGFLADEDGPPPSSEGQKAHHHEGDETCATGVVDERSSDAHDSLLLTTTTTRKPFSFRSRVDVEQRLTKLALQDIRVEYVRFKDSLLEPLLQIEVAPGDCFVQDALAATHPDSHYGNSERISPTVDLVPGVYEGGATVWECSKDLLEFLVSNKNDLIHKNHVLELGCGHALPSCWWLRERLAGLISDETENKNETDFCLVCTDFNDFVIESIVLPNISVNTRQHMPSLVAKHITVGAGDWMEMTKQLSLPQQDDVQHDDSIGRSIQVQGLPSDGRFDLILAAETIYSERAAKETVELLQRHLKLNSGIALVATKRYYFGVGGGTHAFCKYASGSATDTENLKVTILQVYDNGAGNIRELLKVECVSHSTRD